MQVAASGVHFTPSSLTNWLSDEDNVIRTIADNGLLLFEGSEVQMGKLFPLFIVHRHIAGWADHPHCGLVSDDDFVCLLLRWINDARRRVEKIGSFSIFCQLAAITGTKEEKNAEWVPFQGMILFSKMRQLLPSKNYVECERERRTGSHHQKF